MEEGRIAIATNAGRAAVDAGPIGAIGFCKAGNRERDPRADDRWDRRTAKSCGPGARVCASRLVWCVPHQGLRIGDLRDDGE